MSTMYEGAPGQPQRDPLSVTRLNNMAAEIISDINSIDGDGDASATKIHRSNMPSNGHGQSTVSDFQYFLTTIFVDTF